jgi:hypothetical protein
MGASFEESLDKLSSLFGRSFGAGNIPILLLSVNTRRGEARRLRGIVGFVAHQDVYFDGKASPWRRYFLNGAAHSVYPAWVCWEARFESWKDSRAEIKT